MRQADPIQQNLVHDDSKAERGDSEIMAAQTSRENRQCHSGNPGQHRAEHEGRPERHPEAHDEQRRGICADAVEGGVAKVELAGIAENEIEADREDDIERAHDQVRAPIGVLEDKRQHRDGDDRDSKPAPAAH